MADSAVSQWVVRVLVVATALVAALLTHVIDRHSASRFDVHDLSPAEAIETVRWLDDYYAAPDGLQRPSGLVQDGKLDHTAIGTWLFQNYLQERARGATAAEARTGIAKAIRDTPEWQSKHR